LPLRPQQNELLPLLEPPLLEPPLVPLVPPLLDPPLLDPPLLEPPLLDPPLLLLHAKATKDMETRAMTTWDRMGCYLVGNEELVRGDRSRPRRARPSFEG